LGAKPVKVIAGVPMLAKSTDERLNVIANDVVADDELRIFISKNCLLGAQGEKEDSRAYHGLEVPMERKRHPRHELRKNRLFTAHPLDE